MLNPLFFEIKVDMKVDLQIWIIVIIGSSGKYNDMLEMKADCPALLPADGQIGPNVWVNDSKGLHGLWRAEDSEEAWTASSVHAAAVASVATLSSFSAAGNQT